MKRKAIQLSSKTIVVSLPSKWVQEHKVKKGDEMNLDILDNKIVISTDKLQEGNKTLVDITNREPMTKRILGAIYKAGYDEMEVRFGNAKELEIVQEVVREEFIGFEVTHQGKNILTAKEISNINPGEFGTILRRMFLVVITMSEDSRNAMQQGDYEWLKSIALRDKDTNKLADYCRRILNKGSSPEARAAALYFIVEQLEKIGDCYRDLCMLGCLRKSKTSSETERMFEAANSYLKDFYQMYYNFNLEEMTRFGKRRYELKEKLSRLQTKSAEQEIMFMIRRIIDTTFDMNGPLMTARL